MFTVSFDPLAIGKFLLAVVVAAAAFFLFRAIWRGLRRLFFRTELYGLDRKGILARWNGIEQLTASGNEMNLKMAVMEADKLLDHALKAMAMAGTTLGERLKFAAYKYPKIQEVWWAHRLRNQLVHESSFYLEPAMARRAIQTFKKALQMLNLL